MVDPYDLASRDARHVTKIASIVPGSTVVTSHNNPGTYDARCITHTTTHNHTHRHMPQSLEDIRREAQTSLERSRARRTLDHNSDPANNPHIPFWQFGLVLMYVLMYATLTIVVLGVLVYFIHP